MQFDIVPDSWVLTAKLVLLSILAAVMIYAGYYVLSLRQDLADTQHNLEKSVDKVKLLEQDLTVSLAREQELQRSMKLLVLVADDRDKALKQLEAVDGKFKQNLKDVRKSDAKTTSWLDTPVPDSVIRMLSTETP